METYRAYIDMVNYATENINANNEQEARETIKEMLKQGKIAENDYSNFNIEIIKI